MDLNEFFDNEEVKKVNLDNAVYVFCDTETTGLSEEKERMTEIAMIKTDSNFNVIEEFEMMINPERKISEFITKLTGITEDMVKDELKYEDAIPVIEEFWNDNSFVESGDPAPRLIFVAHNAPFDIKFVNKAFQDVLGKNLVTEFIDTVSLARELKPFWRNHKLETCAQKFNILNEDHHRALNDTRVLMQIGKILIPEFIESGLDPVNFVTKKNLHYKKG